MKKIDTSAITSTSAMKFKSGALDHLQKSSSEMLTYLAEYIATKGGIGSTGLYILDGVNPSLSGGTITWAKGLILYNSELYYIQAGSRTITTSARFTISTSYNTGANADPILFSDGASKNVLQNREITIRDNSSVPSGETNTGVDPTGTNTKYVSKYGGYFYSTESAGITISTVQSNIKTNIIAGKCAYKTNLKITVNMQLSGGTATDTIVFELYDRDTLAVIGQRNVYIQHTSDKLETLVFIDSGASGIRPYNFRAATSVGNVSLDILSITIEELPIGLNQ